MNIKEKYDLTINHTGNFSKNSLIECWIIQINFLPIKYVDIIRNIVYTLNYACFFVFVDLFIN